MGDGSRLFYEPVQKAENEPPTRSLVAVGGCRECEVGARVAAHELAEQGDGELCGFVDDNHVLGLGVTNDGAGVGETQSRPRFLGCESEDLRGGVVVRSRDDHVPGGVFEDGPDGHAEGRGLSPSPIGQEDGSGRRGVGEKGGQLAHDASLFVGSLGEGRWGRQGLGGSDSLVAFETAFESIPASRARVLCGVGKDGQQGTRGHNTGGGHTQDQGSPAPDETVALAEHVGLEAVVQVEADGIEALSQQAPHVGGGCFSGAYAQDAPEVTGDLPLLGRGFVWRTAEDEAFSVGGHEGIPAGSRADVKGGGGLRPVLACERRSVCLWHKSVLLGPIGPHRAPQQSSTRAERH